MTEVHAAIEAIRQNGQVDIVDRFLVVSQCQKLGYTEAAQWVAKNPRAYAPR